MNPNNKTCFATDEHGLMGARIKLFHPIGVHRCSSAATRLFEFVGFGLKLFHPIGVHPCSSVAPKPVGFFGFG
jgi:hypothetical protein